MASVVGAQFIAPGRRDLRTYRNTKPPGVWRMVDHISNISSAIPPGVSNARLNLSARSPSAMRTWPLVSIPAHYPLLPCVHGPLSQSLRTIPFCHAYMAPCLNPCALSPSAMRTQPLGFYLQDAVYSICCSHDPLRYSHLSPALQQSCCLTFHLRSTL